ncbi:hypothetical protein BGAL_0254g00190 [Botrytis galanthina]|uniref:Uncharacterized protein n=1 Tax=Botrytis galanthina TaxID=278940 RepID=A0A4S8QSY2_9HELO|nr:hypothetical protein BGAL_0254g00190 [Botrytis galanthina]
MKEFSINSTEAFPFPPSTPYKQSSLTPTAFLLILINLYELIAAFQDNWAVYKFGIVSRLAAAGVFWSFGGEWVKVVFVELGTLVLLAGDMVVA